MNDCFANWPHYRERVVVLLADNNAHPNPASSLQNEVLRIGLNGKGWGWMDWDRVGVEQLDLITKIT